jgi:hypothetical protein
MKAYFIDVQFSQSFQNPHQAQFVYSPPKKRSRGLGGMGGPRGGGVRALPSLMPKDFNPYAEDTPDYEMPIAYQSAMQLGRGLDVFKEVASEDVLPLG